MNKKIVFNGIEMVTNESDCSAQNMLGLVESIVGKLEANLDQLDENFTLSISINFTPGNTTKYCFSMTNLLNNDIKQKVMNILEKVTNTRHDNMAGTMKIDLQVLEPYPL
jgi:hypothetical protein